MVKTRPRGDARIFEDCCVRVIFTDFDGVLHSAAASEGLSRSVVQAASLAELRRRGLFAHCAWLAEEIRAAPEPEHVRIVVHSSWRAHFRDDQIRGFMPELTPWFQGTVGFNTLGRDAAILKWLELMGGKVADYLVLDDVAGLFGGGSGKWAKLVLCEPSLGLGDPKVQAQVRDFLRGKRRGESDDLGALEFESVKISDLKAELRKR
jgi:hypothetical protein